MHATHIYRSQHEAPATSCDRPSAPRPNELDRRVLGFILSQRNKTPHVVALDVGCGPGTQAAWMARAGSTVVAIDSEDYSDAVTAAMRQEGILSGYVFIHERVQAEPGVGPFDVVVCRQVLHLLPHEEAKRALCWMHEVASTGARLYLSVPTMRSNNVAAMPYQENSSMGGIRELEILVRESGWQMMSSFHTEALDAIVVAEKVLQ